MNSLTLDFKKDRDSVDYYWEQPNVPWVVVSKDNEEDSYDAKICLDYKRKKVYVKMYDGENYAFTHFGNFLIWEFNLREYENILNHSDDFFWDMVIDLKRNLHNKQHQKILFTFEKNQLGAKKL